jgi:hypothetical protein
MMTTLTIALFISMAVVTSYAAVNTDCSNVPYCVDGTTYDQTTGQPICTYSYDTLYILASTECTNELFSDAATLSDYVYDWMQPQIDGQQTQINKALNQIQLLVNNTRGLNITVVDIATNIFSALINQSVITMINTTNNIINNNTNNNILSKQTTSPLLFWMSIGSIAIGVINATGLVVLSILTFKYRKQIINVDAGATLELINTSPSVITGIPKLTPQPPKISMSASTAYSPMSDIVLNH